MVPEIEFGGYYMQRMCSNLLIYIVGPFLTQKSHYVSFCLKDPWKDILMPGDLRFALTFIILGSSFLIFLCFLSVENKSDMALFWWSKTSRGNSLSKITETQPLIMHDCEHGCFSILQELFCRVFKSRHLFLSFTIHESYLCKVWNKLKLRMEQMKSLCFIMHT